MPGRLSLRQRRNFSVGKIKPLSYSFEWMCAYLFVSLGVILIGLLHRWGLKGIKYLNIIYSFRAKSRTQPGWLCVIHSSVVWDKQFLHLSTLFLMAFSALEAVLLAHLATLRWPYKFTHNTPQWQSEKKLLELIAKFKKNKQTTTKNNMYQKVFTGTATLGSFSRSSLLNLSRSTRLVRV